MRTRLGMQRVARWKRGSARRCTAKVVGLTAIRHVGRSTRWRCSRRRLARRALTRSLQPGKRRRNPHHTLSSADRMFLRDCLRLCAENNDEFLLKNDCVLTARAVRVRARFRQSQSRSRSQRQVLTALAAGPRVMQRARRPTQSLWWLRAQRLRVLRALDKRRRVWQARMIVRRMRTALGRTRRAMRHAPRCTP